MMTAELFVLGVVAYLAVSLLFAVFLLKFYGHPPANYLGPTVGAFGLLWPVMIPATFLCLIAALIDHFARQIAGRLDK